MKSPYKNLLSVLGAVGLMMPFLGCESEAEAAEQEKGAASAGSNTSTNTNKVESASAATNNVPSTNSSDTAALASSSTNLTDSTTDNLAVPDSGTNAVAGSTNAPVIARIPPTLPSNVKLSKPVEEIVKLAQGGLSETVMLLYVEKATEPFDLDAAEIVYLNDIGVPSTVIAAMLSRDGASDSVLVDAVGTNKVEVAAAPAAAPTVAPQAPPQQLEVSSNYVASPQVGATTVWQDPNAVAQAQPQPQTVIVEQQPATVVVEQPAVTYSYFYSSLSPYGSWVSVPDYGWCWQPTIAVTHRGWRPYAHGGRWLYSDVGWYWHSDYSWGWAPFHYGRWHCAPRLGWVWTPDYTWGPSWVTWRRGGDYCGWAPLPPRSYVRPGVGFSYWGSDVGFSFSFGYSSDYYCWVPTRRFCDRRPIDHVVPSHQSRNIYKDSTVVNNYIVGNNNTIINNGIGRDYVAARTGSEIPRVRVADAPAGVRGEAARPDRLQRVGTDTVVYRPNRPSQNLVAAHEAAVSRSRNEIVRPSDASAPPVRGSAGRIERPQSNGSGASSGIAAGANAASGATRPGSLSRNEIRRPQTASATPPAFATPAPLRPEPDRSSEIIRARSVQEARVRPNAAFGAVNSSSQGTQSSGSQPPVVRPGGSIAPRFTPDSSTSASGGTSAVNPSRPNSTRTEVARPSGGTGVIPSTQPAAPQVTRPSTATPSGRPVPVAPAVNRGAAETPRTSPATPQVTRTTPQVVRPGSGVAQSPSFARPVPNNAPPANPVSTPSTVAPARQNNPATVVRPTPGASSPAFTRPAPAQNPVRVSPQPVQSQPPQNTAPAPSVAPRRESFSRPSSQFQSAPAPVVVQPRSVTPVTRPQYNSPSVPAPPPVVRSAPSMSGAPIRGGNFQSAPAAAAPAPSVRSAPSSGSSRPPQNSPQGGGSRGRMEIGR